MTDTQFKQLTAKDKVWYGKGVNRKIYPIEGIVDTGGLRQIWVNNVVISNPGVVELVVSTESEQP